MSAVLDCNLLSVQVFVHSLIHSLTFSYTFSAVTNFFTHSNKLSVAYPDTAISSEQTLSTARYQVSSNLLNSERNLKAFRNC